MKKIFLTLFLLISILPSSAFAIMKNGEQVLIDKVVEDDLYIASGSAIINGDIHGELMVLGGIVEMNGNVAEDVFVAGGNINLNGDISDDLKVAGGNINIKSKIGENVLCTGGSLVFQKESKIGRNIDCSSGYLALNGIIENNLNYQGGTILINGLIKGNAIIKAENIVFRENAKVSGNLYYESNKAIEGIENYVTGEITFQKVQEWSDVSQKMNQDSSDFFRLGKLIEILYSSIFLLVIGFILWLFSPKLILAIGEPMRKKTLTTILTGICATFFLPIIALLVVVVPGFMVSIFLVSLWIFGLYFGRIALISTLGLLLIYSKKATKNRKMIFLSYTIGVFIYEILANLPFLGFFITVFCSIFGFGAFIITSYDFIKLMRQKKII